jgi:hypothetical protein
MGWWLEHGVWVWGLGVGSWELGVWGEGEGWDVGCGVWSVGCFWALAHHGEGH